MLMYILGVKVGTKYSSEDVNKLPIDICLTDDPSGIKCDYVLIEESDKWKKLQWHKTTFFRKNFGGLSNGTEVIVMDIDQHIIDLDSIIKFPYDKFCAFRRWWMTEHGEMSGGLYKFRIGELSIIDDNFTPEWQEYWVKNKMVRPPVNGEQNYVEMMMKNNITYFPDDWCTKWTNSDIRNNMIEQDFHCLTGDLLRIGNEWNDNLKIIHYAGTGYK